VKAIAITANKRVELLDRPEHTGPLGSSEVAGPTLVSLVSPGTEIHANFLGSRFPSYPGYACVFQIEDAGSDVTDLQRGDMAFSMGEHGSVQREQRQRVLPVPPGLVPEEAVFARLIGVGMTTLNTTNVRPPAHILVTGLGPVGNLAAQVFALCGYQVTAVDPVEARREAAAEAGIQDVRSAVDAPPNDLKGRIALHLECSGHEQAALDGCRTVCRHGEVVLVGLAWKRRTECYAAELLAAVFRNFAVLRSGWEWELPVLPERSSRHSMFGNYRIALDWLAERKIRVDHLAALYQPEQAQQVYEGLLNQTLPKPTALFDWQGSREFK